MGMAISLISLDQISNMVISLIIMQVFKKYDSKSPTIQLYLRISYFVFQFINFLFLFVIHKRLIKNDNRKLKIKNTKLFSEEEEEIEMTSEYDKTEYNKALKNAVMQFVIISVLNYKWQLPQPLIIQSASVLKSIFLNPLYMTYLRRVEVVRPFDKNFLYQDKVDSKQKEE